MSRIFDLVASSVGLVLLSPVMLVVACVVKVDSPGPILFRQKRVGRHGREFMIHKFRTMSAQGAGPAITVGEDPRITRSGAWLRSTKLDELPQLFNVLKGDMCVVGPRPEVPEYVAHWPRESREKILRVRPGITDPASIEFRREAELLARADDPQTYYVDVILPRKVALYVKYAEERSLLGDIKIVIKTILSVVRN